jgi:hypothetical protein
MKWYLAKLVFHISQEEDSLSPQFDEQLRLICAEMPKEAYDKAEAFGYSEEEEFKRGAGERVSWRFVAVAELIPIKFPADGMLLYSFSPEVDDPAAYLDYLRLKSDQLLQSITQKERLM